jgi:hypothetical protein
MKQAHNGTGVRQRGNGTDFLSPTLASAAAITAAFTPREMRRIEYRGWFRLSLVYNWWRWCFVRKKIEK